jgi:N-acyl-D-amino-acid deacylase
MRQICAVAKLFVTLTGVQEMHDLIIEGARIVDGTGKSSYVGSVAIAAGKISELGTQGAAELGAARETISAHGLVLAPGVIDAHTHYDAQITWDPTASPSLELGVTTVLMGNCGFTIAPCKPQDREITLKNLTQVEGMSLDALLDGTHWGFESFPEYLDMLEGKGVGPNVAAYCGHSSLRTWVMGTEAAERAATADEVAQMQELLRQALRAGALGFATSTFEGHNGWGGVPMPSRLADESEMRALIGTLGEEGRGCFMLTKGRNDRIEFFEEMAAQTGRPMLIAAIVHDDANPHGAMADLAGIEAAAKRGHPIYAQVPCTPISMDLRLDGFYAFEGMAAWKPAIGLYNDHPQLKALYAGEQFRNAVKEELVAPGALNRFTDQWHLMEVLEVAKPQNSALVHRTVGDLAAEQGMHPLDWMLDFAISEDFGTVFNAQILNSNEDEVLKLLKSDSTSITLSDAGAHLSLFCDAGYALHLLSRWVRERKDFTLEEAIYRLTGAQADIYRLRGRGRIALGNAADLWLFDPDTVGRTDKRRVADLPAGAERLVTGAEGIEAVWVNGVRVVDNNGLMSNNEHPGEVLRVFD